MQGITEDKTMYSGIWALEIVFMVNGIDAGFESFSDDCSWKHLFSVIKHAGQNAEFRRVEDLFNNKFNLPAVCRKIDGSFFVLLGIKKDNGQVLILNAFSKSPIVLNRDELYKITDGNVLFIKKTSETEFGLRWFFYEIVKFQSIFLSILLGTFVLQILAMAAPLFTQVILDKVLLHQALNTLNVLTLGFFILIIFEFLIKISRNYILVNTTNKIDARLGAEIYRRLLTMPYVYFDTRKVGEVISRVREIDRIREFLTDKSVSVIIDTIFSLLFVVIMLIYSLKLTLFVLFFIIFSALMYALITPELRRRLEEKFRKSARENSYLVESITGIETVKSLSIEEQMNNKWEDRLGEYINAGYNLNIMGYNTGAAITLLQKLMTIGILYYGVIEVIGNRLSVGQLIAFQMFAAQFSVPMLRLVNLWNDFQQTLLAVDRIGEILNCKCEETGGQIIHNLKGYIRFEKVSFRYKPESQDILNGISFEIKPGERIGIAGRSGSGKSTIGKLLRRLYTPTEGKIYIDGIDLMKIAPHSIRKHIGTVLQDNFLFSGTIKENILLLSPYSAMSEVAEAGRLSGADEFIKELPDGYETDVGERGGALSGGQRQRIGIARSLIREPEILLYDEATSALDYETEWEVLKNIQRVSKGKTAVIIAHRLSSLKWCDRILFIDNGRILEQGTHQQLIALGGNYCRLYLSQESGTEC